jgi:hypothetical protein
MTSDDYVLILNVQSVFENLTNWPSSEGTKLSDVKQFKGHLQGKRALNTQFFSSCRRLATIWW